MADYSSSDASSTLPARGSEAPLPSRNVNRRRQEELSSASSAPEEEERSSEEDSDGSIEEEKDSESEPDADGRARNSANTRAKLKYLEGAQQQPNGAGNDSAAGGESDGIVSFETILERAKDVEYLCNGMVEIKVSSLPHFREAIKAFVQNIEVHNDTIKEYTGLNDVVDASLHSVLGMLTIAFNLLTRIREQSQNYMLRLVLNSKYRNKVRQCQTNLQGVEHRLFQALHTEMLQSSQGPQDAVPAWAPNSNRSKIPLAGSSKHRKVRPQAEEWCLTADRHYSGLGVAQSYSLSFRNYLRAAKSGMVRAMNCVGCMYQYGRGVDVSLQEAEGWFRQAVASNDSDGMNNLAMLLQDKIVVSLEDVLAGKAKDSRQQIVDVCVEVEKLLRASSEMENLDAMNNLGHLYENSSLELSQIGGPQKDTLKAINWYQKAAERGYAKAQNNLGSIYYSGRGLATGPSYEKAVELFRKSAAQGNPLAQNNLGICHEMGRGLPKDYLAASKLYSKSAMQNNPSGMNNWGYMLVRQAESVGGREDAFQYKQAADLFRAAIAAGDVLDSSITSKMAQREFSGAARRHDRKEMGHCSADACFNLASLYEAGYGVTRDLPAAFLYYCKAADYPARPHTRAATRTAAMLYSGSGTARNFCLAKKYYLKAASKGDAEAENALGIMIEEGLGNDENGLKGIGDPKAAAIWYRRAGQQGNAYAFLNLARLHVRGVGVEKSITFAKHLLDRAADAGLHEAQVERKRISSVADEGIEEVNSYLGMVDFADHNFDYGRVKETAEAELKKRQASQLAAVTQGKPVMDQLDMDVFKSNLSSSGRLADPVPGMNGSRLIEAKRIQEEKRAPPERPNEDSNRLQMLIETEKERKRLEKRISETKLAPPPPGVRSASMIESQLMTYINDEVVEEFPSDSETSKSEAKGLDQVEKILSGAGLIGSASPLSGSQFPSSPDLPPRAAAQLELPQSPKHFSPPLPPRRAGEPASGKKAVNYVDPETCDDVIMFKERLEEVRDEYGEDSLEEATALHNVGKVYAKVIEHNMKLDPSNNAYSLGLEAADEYYTKALNTRILELGKYDHLVVKSYKALAKLYGRLGAGHKDFSKSSHYAKSARGISKKMKESSSSSSE
jgi:TPR repeat protein